MKRLFQDIFRCPFKMSRRTIGAEWNSFEKVDRRLKSATVYVNRELAVNCNRMSASSLRVCLISFRHFDWHESATWLKSGKVNKETFFSPLLITQNCNSSSNFWTQSWFFCRKQMIFFLPNFLRWILHVDVITARRKKAIYGFAAPHGTQLNASHPLQHSSLTPLNN